MSSAFKCNRCGKFSESVSQRTSYNYQGELARLIYPPNERANFDICGTCKATLLIVIRKWWNGLLPE